MPRKSDHGVVGKFSSEGVELKGRVPFGLRLWEGDASQEHVMSIDMSFSVAEAVNLMVKMLKVDAAKPFRALGSHTKVREMTSKTLTKGDIYKSEGKLVSKAASLENATNEQLITALRKRGMSDLQIAQMLGMELVPEPEPESKVEVEVTENK
jgi:hypothetical protein